MRRIVFTIFGIIFLTSLMYSQNHRSLKEQHEFFNHKIEKEKRQIKEHDPIVFQKQNKSKVNTDKGILYRPAVVYIDDSMKKQTYTYNANGNVLTALEEKWSNGAWVNDTRNTYTYDTQGNELTMLREYWQNGVWVNYCRYSYTYDFDGKELTKSTEYWENGDWTYAERYNYSYNINGTIYTEILENWSMGGWINVMKTTWTYDAQGNLLTELHELGNNVWLLSSRITYTFDTQGNTYKRLYEKWYNGGWVNSNCNTYTHDSQGNQITNLIENWDNGIWVNSMRYDYTYDAQGNKLTDLWQHWRNESWVEVLLRTYAYDNNNNGISGTSDSWNGISWAPYTGPIDIKYNNNEDLISIYAKKASVKYISFTAVENFENLPNNFTLSQNFPNPFNPSTTISFDIPKSEFVTLKVFDILGKEVTTLINEEMIAGNYTKTWDAKNLSSGVYFYKLQAGKFTETKKMVLVR